MLVAIIRIPAPADAEAATALEQLFAERLPLVAGAPGFVGFELLRPMRGTREYLSVSRWADRAAFDAWVQSESSDIAHGRHATTDHGSAGDAPPGVELYELSES